MERQIKIKQQNENRMASKNWLGTKVVEVVGVVVVVVVGIVVNDNGLNQPGHMIISDFELT